MIWPSQPHFFQRPTLTRQQKKHKETDTVFYKDGIPGTKLRIRGTPEMKAGGGFRYPVLTADGKPFMRAGKQVDVVDELDLLSEEQHKNEAQKKDEIERSKLRQLRDKVSQLVGRKK